MIIPTQVLGLSLDIRSSPTNHLDFSVLIGQQTIQLKNSREHLTLSANHIRLRVVDIPNSKIHLGLLLGASSINQSGTFLPKTGFISRSLGLLTELSVFQFHWVDLNMQVHYMYSSAKKSILDTTQEPPSAEDAQVQPNSPLLKLYLHHFCANTILRLHFPYRISLLGGLQFDHYIGNESIESNSAQQFKFSNSLFPTLLIGMLYTMQSNEFVGITAIQGESSGIELSFRKIF